MKPIVETNSRSIETKQRAGGDSSSSVLFDLCQSMLNNSSDRENLRGPEDEMIRELCERIGYGAVMDSAARQWRRKDPVGAFVTGPCIGTLVHDLNAHRSSGGLSPAAKANNNLKTQNRSWHSQTKTRPPQSSKINEPSSSN